MSRRHALVIGGSLGGLIAAHLMRSIGWDATVFERNASDLIDRGAGLGTHPALLEALRRIGIEFDISMGVALDTVVCLGRDGSVIVRRPTLRTMTAWGRLYRMLRQRLPGDRYRLGMALKPVGGNKQVRTHARPIGQAGGDAVMVLVDAMQRHPEAITVAR